VNPKDSAALRKIAQAYSQILSTPFIPQPRINFIKSFIKELPFEVVENNYALIVKVPGLSSKKLVLMSHLDHPGIIVKNRREGLCLGSLFPDRLQKIISKQGFIPLDIYSPTGTLLTQGKLIGLRGKYLQKAVLDIPTKVPTNSSAYYQISLFRESKEFLSLYAADNDVPTICMLHLLRNIPTKPAFTLYFVFTFYEEVHQISSFHLARKNLLRLSPDDLVLNMECKKVDNNVHNPPKNRLDYNSGVILQPNEKDCLYGYRFTSPNLLERLVLRVCQKAKIPLQYGLGLGSSDARPFSNFKITPNLCTLEVPNRFKHNCDDQGNIVLEKLYKQDLFTMYQIIFSLIFTKGTHLADLSSSKNIFLSDRHKIHDLVTNSQAMSRKIRLNYRLELANQIKVITKQYYPTNIFFLVLDIVMNFVSYPYYLFLTILKLS